MSTDLEYQARNLSLSSQENLFTRRGETFGSSRLLILVFLFKRHSVQQNARSRYKILALYVCYSTKRGFHSNCSKGREDWKEEGFSYICTQSSHEQSLTCSSRWEKMKEKQDQEKVLFLQTRRVAWTWKKTYQDWRRSSLQSPKQYQQHNQKQESGLWGKKGRNEMNQVPTLFSLSLPVFVSIASFLPLPCRKEPEEGNFFFLYKKRKKKNSVPNFKEQSCVFIRARFWAGAVE